MAQRAKYWSCSPFADWIRGIEKGGAKTGRGWRDWEIDAKTKYPVRYWIAEEALDAVQNFIWWPVDKIYDVKYYINNRWVSRTHSLTAHPRDIKPGQWQDVGNRFLPCLFNELVDFVEIETAWSHIAWSDKKDTAKYNPPFWASGWFRWRVWRCPEAGLDHLDWAMTLTNNDWCEPDDPEYGKATPQAESAKEIKELYLWWKEVYPNRPDPHDVSGWTAYCEMRRQRGDHMLDLADKTPEEAEMARVALDKTQEIEQLYEAEDEAMMIRLIKIRGRLWT
jgi:hypothetical protein